MVVEVVTKREIVWGASCVGVGDSGVGVIEILAQDFDF